MNPDPAVVAFSERASALWRQGALLACLEELEGAQSLLLDTPNLAAADVREGVAVRLGATRLRLGRLSEALTGLNDLLEASDSGYAALQLGNVLRYLGRRDEAEGHLKRAFIQARLQQDGVLAIAALTGLGELHLDAGAGRPALEAFGRALGLTEFSGDERPTVAPLAGLGHSHALNGNAAKGQALAERALLRARRHGDRVGVARARFTLAVAAGEVAGFELAELSARAAPHRPLWLRARYARWPALHPDERREAAASTRRMGMPEARHPTPGGEGGAG